MLNEDGCGIKFIILMLYITSYLTEKVKIFEYDMMPKVIFQR